MTTSTMGDLPPEAGPDPGDTVRGGAGRAADDIVDEWGWSRSPASDPPANW
jgi:hypothetical protein